MNEKAISFGKYFLPSAMIARGLKGKADQIN